MIRMAYIYNVAGREPNDPNDLSTKFPGLDLCYTGPAQYITTTDIYDLDDLLIDDLDRDISDGCSLIRAATKQK